MDNLLNLNSENFNEFISSENKLVLLDFYADWCGPCRTLAPVLDEIAEDFKDNLIVGKINVDKNHSILKENKQFKVRSIPQMYIVKNGEILKSIIGVKTKEALSSVIEDLL